MSRGKWKSTLVKQAVGQAVLEAESILLATEKMKQKIHAKKSLFDSFREHIGKFVDRADPIELLALGAGTLLVHDVLKANLEVLNKIGEIVPEGVTVGFPYSLLGQYAYKYINPDYALETAPKEIDPNSLFLWGLSFFLAFIVVKRPDLLVNGYDKLVKLALWFI